jgi:hypothetical protein
MDEHSEHEEHGYQEGYGQDHHYAEGEEAHTEEYASDDSYDQSQLPMQDHRSFMQKYGNIVIFGGVGAVILIMGYVTFAPMLTSKPTQQTAATQTAADASALLKPVTQSNGMAPTATPTDNNPNNMPKNVIATAPMPAPAPAPLAGASANPAQPAANAMNVSPTAPVTNDPATSNDPWTQAASGNPSPPAAAPVMPPAAANSQPVAPPPAAPVTSNADAEKIQALQQKLDQADAQRQDQSATISELQNRLAEAESKVSAMQQQQPTTTTADNNAASVAAPTVKTKKSSHAAKPKPDDNAPQQPSADTKIPDTWELRSASDGVAWVSRPSDNQLYRVAVGDTLPGVGRITAISQQGDSWIIIGTTGQIRQN